MKQHRIALSVATATLVLLTLSGSARGLLVDLVGHWSAPLVAALEAKGLVSGDSLGRYEPEAPLTRAQFAKLLSLSLGNDAEAVLLSSVASRFTDVPNWHWAKGYVESLAESAVTTGYGDGRFGPNETVTRAEMAAFLVRAAGLSDQARLRAQERTPFADDQGLTAWARGPVVVASSMGLFTGFDDGSFRPNQPITRAEGAAALLRLEAYRGTAFHLAGTLVRFNPVSGQGDVRDALGVERSFTMAPEAVYYHSGVGVTATRIAVFDQVWIVKNSKGEGAFLEARYADLLGKNPKLTGSSLEMTTTENVSRLVRLQTGILTFLNGRRAELTQLAGAQDVYVALDVITGEARVVDAVRTDLQGIVAGANFQESRLFVNVNGRIAAHVMKTDAVILVNGQRLGIEQIQVGDRVRLAVDDQGAATYVQAER